MKPAPFEYFSPTTLAEAISTLAGQDDDLDVKILAGGQSLMPLLNMRLARPEILVDLGKLTELDYLREESGGLAIGAMTTKRAVEDAALVKDRHPMLHAATTEIGHQQIRNRGTVGGSLAQADPAAEYPALALVLGAEIDVVGPDGKRTIAADDFFVTYLTTDMEEGEILSEVRFPFLAANTGWSFQEIARRHGDFAMAGVAATVTLDGGTISDAHVVLFAVGPVPQRMTAVEDAVRGQAPSEALFAQAAQTVAAALEEPMSDVHASADYRRQLAEVLTRRGLAEATQRAQGGTA